MRKGCEILVEFYLGNVFMIFNQPGGSVFITTLNQTIPMWVGGILIGEYVVNAAPKGTHRWEQLISPLNVQRILDTSTL